MDAGRKDSTAAPLSLLAHATRVMFFTGKGGVGKTTLACATALALADSGRAVLLISTDPASNLDEMLATPLANTPRPVAGAPGLAALNIDPEQAADAYRQRVLAQMARDKSDADRALVLEQLSGACTTEIAAFDEFVALLTTDSAAYDHVIFDTAPTGHTLRLLSLPKAWTGFLADNDRGASCLGPHSGLKMQEQRFRAALRTLGDAEHTTIVLVTRPERGAIREAARTSVELRELGLANQRLAINGVFMARDDSDVVAQQLAALGARALTEMPAALATLPQDRIALRAFDMVGVARLRQVFDDPDDNLTTTVASLPGVTHALPDLAALVEQLAAPGHGLIMVMGKGGVGKTTIAAALAVGLATRGHAVHLSTTDPAAHLSDALQGNLPGLDVARIDPARETASYIARIMATRGKDLDAAGRALLLEDLRSPCTEEVAVFHAFAHTVASARSAFVVLDTAPTGHTLLLLDATGAYHRQMLRNFSAQSNSRVITPLMRLKDRDYSKVILVTLPEVTPVSEAAALQEDLRRAGIEPYAWVVNRSLLGAGTRDPLLCERMRGEVEQLQRVEQGLAQRVFLLPWQGEPPVGVPALRALVS
jgi:arsenite-transporting ATPase